MFTEAFASLFARVRTRSSAEATLQRLHRGTPLRLERKLRALLRRRFTVLPRRLESRPNRSAALRASARADGMDEVVTSLRVSLANGGTETALRHADELVSAGRRVRFDADALDLVARAFIAAGRQREARELWERHARPAD